MPQFDDSPEALLRRSGAALRACVGTTIDETWIAWDTRDDQWFPDEAVILRIAGQSLEIVCWKLNEISVSWNAIDVRSTPAWVADWDSDFKLEWRRDGLAELAGVVGQTVREINVLEYLYRTTVVSARGNPANVGRKSEAWLLHGLEFELSDSTLTVFNALDENGITLTRSTGADFRRTVVPRVA